MRKKQQNSVEIKKSDIYIFVDYFSAIFLQIENKNKKQTHGL